MDRLYEKFSFERSVRLNRCYIATGRTCEYTFVYSCTHRAPQHIFERDGPHPLSSTSPNSLFTSHSHSELLPRHHATAQDDKVVR